MPLVSQEGFSRNLIETKLYPSLKGRVFLFLFLFVYEVIEDLRDHFYCQKDKRGKSKKSYYDVHEFLRCTYA